jgi:thiamine pyrophosphokinase
VPAAIVFAAAPLEPTQRLRARLAVLDQPLVIAADAGATTALAFGFTPDLVIGDFDSLDPSTLPSLTRETFPRDKDQTDGQLAIQRALQHAPTELYLVGFLGGPRLDQALANIFLLTSVEVPTFMLDERNECHLLRGSADHTWSPESDEVISLIPITEVVKGVTTHGLRWELSQAVLLRGETRGVSNEPIADHARVEIGEGLLLLTRHFRL